MEDRMTLTIASAKPRRSGRKRLEDLFGRDWRVGYLFVLPMVLTALVVAFDRLVRQRRATPPRGEPPRGGHHPGRGPHNKH